MREGMQNTILNFRCKQVSKLRKTLLYFTKQLLASHFFENVLQSRPSKMVSCKTA